MVGYFRNATTVIATITVTTTMNAFIVRYKVAQISLSHRIYLYCYLYEGLFYYVIFSKHRQVRSMRKIQKYLVLFKQRTAYIAVQRVSEVFFQTLESSFQVLALFRIIDGETEQLNEPGQGVLVHGIDVCQVGD